VPALLSGERVLVSTATKALQDQLFTRDLPRLLKALAVPVRAALLKGRSSYLCLHRMALARHDPSMADRLQLQGLARIETWAQATRSGDLIELASLDEQSPLIPLVTSTRENCLGSQCPQFRACHVNLARREALAADVVVINHHLFFADIAVRESGVAELLPTVRVAIFDEAHQLNDIGVQFLGTSLGSAQLIDFSRDILAAGLQYARGLVDWQGVARDVELASRELRLCLGSAHASGKLAWREVAPHGVHPEDWADAMTTLQQACAYAVAQLDTVSEMAPDFSRLQERARELETLVARFLAPGSPDTVRWVDAGSRAASPVRLVESPLDIAQAFQAKRSAAAVPGERPRAWVFTSATLGNDAQLSWFTQACGLADARVLRLPSPFDYQRQAALYVPAHLPRPAEAGHSAALAAVVLRAALRLGGRALVLTTTLKALRVIGGALQGATANSGQLEVLVQGQAPKRQLMDRFRQGDSAGQPGCVLVASATFWEGFDVAGEALQLVVIDKLPFPPPADPLVEARSRRLESLGRNAFNDYFVAEAALALKQGAGRLIRHESDQGVLLLGDTRLIEMAYGRRLLHALPEMRRLLSEEDLMAELDTLKAGCLPELPPGRST
jgi:ATP-dependent DNA helicase DinG